MDDLKESNSPCARHRGVKDRRSCVPGQPGGVHPGGLPAPQLQRITELMQLDLSRKLPGRRLAEQCGLSVRQFSRAFRRSTGLSPHQYFLWLRLIAARALLLKPACRLNEVALACGFSDQSHFTRAFKAAERMTPGAWRRHNLQVTVS
jgi:AraC family transcriptional regulator